MQALKLDQCSSVSEQNQAVVRFDQRLQELSELQPCMSSCVEQTEEQVLRSPQQRPVFGDQQLTNDLPDLQLEEQVLQIEATKRRCLIHRYMSKMK